MLALSGASSACVTAEGSSILVSHRLPQDESHRLQKARTEIETFPVRPILE